MFEKGKLMFIFAESPLHPGAGSGFSGVDLPIQREGFSNFPIIASSGIKGSLRDFFQKRSNPNDLYVVFGPEEDKASDFAGALGCTEGKIFLFPVRSLKGVFAYLTCPLVLKRFFRDLEYLSSLGWNQADNVKQALSRLFGTNVGEDALLVTNESRIKALDNKVVLEEFTFSSQQNEDLSALAGFLERVLPFSYGIKERIALVSDNAFLDFLMFSTEIFSRNRLDDEKGTVYKGGLWTEEYLPRDTILYSLLLASKPHGNISRIREADQVIEFIKGGNPRFLWVGGDLTVGKGLVRLVLI
jgi:CRISPR-associated protein Cmr4